MSRFLTNPWVHVVFLLGLLGAAVYFSGSPHELRQRLQYATFDTYNKLHPRAASDKIAIVDLDEPSLVQMGQWPWPRTTMAQLVSHLKGMGAKVIAFDIVFAEEDRTSPGHIAQTLPQDAALDSVRTTLSALPDNDAVFAQAIGEAGNVVMGFTRARPEETLRRPYEAAKPTFLLKDKTPFMEKSFAADGVTTNLPEFSRASAGSGSFMATPDIDGLIRKVSLFIKYPPQPQKGFSPELYPMLGLEALRVAINKNARLVVKEKSERAAFDTNYEIKIGKASVPIESDSKFWVYYRDIKPEEYISAYKLFDDAQEAGLKEKINGKIVFIGTSAEGLRDIRSTPLDIFVPGVEVHVNVVEQILQGKFLSRPNIILGVEALLIVIAGLMIIGLAPFINVLLLGVWSIVLMVWMFYGSWLSYQAGILIDPVYPSLALSVLFLASALLSYIRSEAERRRVRQAFGLYIAPSFMEELTKNPDKLKLGGEVRDLTIMFTDIRRFTTISENLTPEQLIQLMNDFLTPMSDLVMSNRGTIDKYMGDAMMAFWNAPLDDPDHARHACLAALKMNEALIPINEQVKAHALSEGREPVLLRAGIGINSGPCSVGNMGSRQRFAYSALGNAANLASRLEGQTKIYGVTIIAGEDTQMQCPDLAWIELDCIRVKGKELAVRIFTLLGDEALARQTHFMEWRARQDMMLRYYRAGQFEEAAKMMEELSHYNDLEAYCAHMTARINAYRASPPYPWDGVYDAADK